MSYVAWFKDITKDSIAIAGGKGANLGEMFRMGIPVPPGFCVTAQTYKEFIERTKIKPKIQQLLTNLNVEDNTQLQKVAEQIQRLILSTPIPEDMADEIMDSYDLLGTNTKKASDLVQAQEVFVAVRSSATAEDLPSISAEEHILLTVNGRPYYRKMKELEWIDPEHNVVEIPALEQNQIRWKRVSSLYKHPASDEKLYKITTTTGREVTISPNHSLLVLDEEKLEPKVAKISQLQGNEKVPAISSLPEINSPATSVDVLEYIKSDNVLEENGKIYLKNNSSNWRIQHTLPRHLPFSSDFAYFLGVYVAEGSTYKNNHVLITNSDKDIQQRIIRFLKNLGLYTEQKINKHTIRVYCKTLVQFLHAIAGEPSSLHGKGKLCSTKKVPEFAFGWNAELRGAFLRGAFDGDGGVENNSIGYSSTSPLLIGGIIKLLEMYNLEFILSQRKSSKPQWRDHQRLFIPSREISKFKEKVNFESIRKQQMLEKSLQNFTSAKSHPEFKHTFSINNLVAKKIKDQYNDNLPKEKVQVPICPSCTNTLALSSSYKQKKRYYCSPCHKMYYEQEIQQKEVSKYMYYNPQGKFQKNMVPWNRGNLQGKVSQHTFSKKMTALNIEKYKDFFTGSVRWDQIKSVEEIPYSGYVYDFTVPGVENFASGVGGIITHNSASFAGQQATFLNVKGRKNVVGATQACWASLFTARAIYYREKNHFDHMNVLICAVVQKMVNATQSGIMFTANPTTNNESEIVIEAIYGLGELIVGGEVNPNMYLVDKATKQIKKIEIRKQDYGLFRNAQGENEKRPIPVDTQARQVLNEKQILEYARLGKKLEEHYNSPQDIEFAVENNNDLYIVQTRAITTLKKKDPITQRATIQEETGKILLKGETASAGVASGRVRIVHDASELGKVEKGDILVTKMTTPDEVPAMQRAAAIVTDEGGLTCFSGDTKIITNKGIITFNQIYSSYSDKEQYLIPSLKINDGKLVWKKIIGVTKRRSKLSQIQISPTLRSSQNFLKVTTDHNFITLQNRKICKKEIRDIINDKEGVLIAEKIPSLAQNATDQNKAYLMGALLSDGHVKTPKQRGYVVGFTQKLTEHKQAFINSVLSNFEKQYGKSFSFKLDKRGDVGQFECFSKVAYQDVLTFEQNIVLEMLTMPEENVLHYLAGIIDGDGTVGQHQIMITVGENNIPILQSVVVACLRLGIQSNICKVKTWYTIHISEKLPLLLTHTKRVKCTYERTLDAKKFVAKQVIEDIISTINQRGKIKYAYLKRDQMISSTKLSSLLSKINQKSEVQFILNSEFRMWRAKEEHILEENDVFNLTVESDNELDHNYVVLTENYSPIIVGNCHAAIVSREMGTPCLVGTEHATEVLKDDEIITVHATRGLVYEGKIETPTQPSTTTKPLPQTQSNSKLITATDIKIILDLPDLAERAAATAADGVGLVRLEIMIASGGIHPAEYIRQGKEKDYITLLKNGIRKIAQAFKNKPIWIRNSDMRSDEYRNLTGGNQEPHETDPMLGWHGIRRLLDEPKILKAEFQAIADLHAEGYKNVGIMLPFIIRVEELRKAKNIMRETGLEPCRDIDFGIMVETPAACWIIEDLCKEGISFVSFGTNDLTQLTLGIDRNNERLANRFDEMHPAVLGEIAKVIKTCQKYHVTTSICGQAGSRAVMAEFLVHQGIDSISANADAVDEIRATVARVERKVLLEGERKKL